MSLTLVVLCLCAVLFAVMGVGSIIVPTRVTAQFGIPSLNREGRSEVRAVYGGFGIAMAAALIAAIFNLEIRSGIAFAVGFALGGMALGRIISAIMDAGIGRLRSLGSVRFSYKSGH